MIASTVGTVLMMLIISPGYSKKYIESQSDGETGRFLAGLVVFMGMVVYFGMWQVRYVKMVQRIYPEKKGDPASMKFQEQWLASCDEAEKEEIYEASYKTYLLTGKVLPINTTSPAKNLPVSPSLWLSIYFIEYPGEMISIIRTVPTVLAIIPQLEDTSI